MGRALRLSQWEERPGSGGGRGRGRRERGRGRRLDLEHEWDLTSRDADGTTALFALSGQPVIGLELTVTNLPSDPAQPQADGDDAHEAQLLVTLPDSLHYSGVRALDPAVRACGRVWWGSLGAPVTQTDLSLSPHCRRSRSACPMRMPPMSSVSWGTP